MNLRDVKPNVLKCLAVECEEEFDEWFRLGEAKHFSTKEPLTPRDIWRTAFSKGAATILKRVDALKDI